MNFHVVFVASFLNCVWCSSVISLPECVTKCWDNSRFVSTCNSESKCLCKDVFFQSALFQCLYTQCQSSQFGAAVHQALSKCSTYEPDDSDNLPPLIRHQELWKRSNKTVKNVSNRASASVIHSTVRRSATFSASSNPCPSKGVAPTTIFDQKEQNTSANQRLFQTSSAVSIARQY